MIAKAKKMGAAPEKPKEKKRVTLYDVNEKAVQIPAKDEADWVARGYRKELPKK